MRAVILALGLMTLSLALSNRNSVQGSFLPDPLNDIENFINNTVLHLKGTPSVQPMVGYVTLTLRLNGPNYPLSAEQQSILVDVVEQLLYSETVIGEVSTISLASMLSSPVADYVEGNASTASTTALVALAPLLEEHTGDVASAFEFVTQNGILSDALMSSTALINAPSTLFLDYAFTEGAYSQPGPISIEPGFTPVPPNDEDIMAAEIREITRSFAHLPLLPVNTSTLDAAISSFPGPEAADANVTIQSVQKTAETAALETIASLQAQLAALQSVNVSALSEDDSADHDQDIMVVQMLLDDEEAYMTSVRSYLPSPAQDPDGDGYLEADLALPLMGRRLQQGTPSTSAVLGRVNNAVTSNLQKLINAKFNAKLGEELARGIAKGVVSGTLSKIPIPIVGDVLNNIFSSLIDPPPEEPCDINCTWDALKARAKDLVRGLLRTEYQDNLTGELRSIRATYDQVKTYDKLTSCAGGAAKTRGEQYGVRVTQLDGVLVGAEGRYLPQVRNKTPDFSKDAGAYLNFLVGMGTLRLMLLTKLALNFEATYCSPPSEALAANNVQSLSTAAKTYTAAIAAARQIARDQRRAAVSISSANCAPCREPGANANFLYRDCDISVDVKDPFINEGAVVKHFQKCVNIHLSEGQLVRNRGFGSRRYSGRNFDAACKRAQAQVLQNVRDQQEKVYQEYDKQLDDYLKPTLLWRQAHDPFATS